MTEFYWLLMGILAVWRVTHLLHAEDGPWDLIVRLRQWAGNGFRGKFLDCFQCLSLWISFPVAWWIAADWAERILLWLALSGGAILLNEAAGHRQTPPALYFEEAESWENSDELLRREKTSTGYHRTGTSGTESHERPG